MTREAELKKFIEKCRCNKGCMYCYEEIGELKGRTDREREILGIIDKWFSKWVHYDLHDSDLEELRSKILSSQTKTLNNSRKVFDDVEAGLQNETLKGNKSVDSVEQLRGSVVSKTPRDHKGDE